VGAWMSVSCILCCQVEVSAAGQSLVQRSPTDWDVSECDRESWTMWRTWPARGSRAIKKNLTRCYTRMP